MVDHFSFQKIYGEYSVVNGHGVHIFHALIFSKSRLFKDLKLFSRKYYYLFIEVIVSMDLRNITY